jgi:hypothetical protein
MDEKQQRKRRGQGPNGPVWPKTLRLEALALTESLIIRRFDRRDIHQALRAKYGAAISEVRLDDLVQSVHRRWKQESEKDGPARSEAQRRALMRLYRSAEADKDWRVCVEIEKLLAKLDGTAAPTKVAVASPEQWAEFEGRSHADLTFYAEHGYWPEDAPKHKASGRSGANGAGANGQTTH